MISFAVTAKLICVFVLAYAKCWFSHDVTQMILPNFKFNGSYHIFNSCVLTASPVDIKWVKSSEVLEEENGLYDVGLVNKVASFTLL